MKNESFFSIEELSASATAKRLGIDNTPSAEVVKNMQRLIDFLEDNDDVQNVWHNWDND